MKDDEVKVGERYLCHVSGQLAVVEVTHRVVQVSAASPVRWCCRLVSTGNLLTRGRAAAELRPDDGTVNR
jgi:hypothetical protein